MSYDPTHRMPPSQERWPAATPAEGWPSYRDGQQEDFGYAGQQEDFGYAGRAATSGNRYQTQGAVATAAYPAVANGYGGYAGAADDFDGRDGYGRDGYGRDGYGYGYQGRSVGYAEPQGGYAEPQAGYADPQGGYADPQGGYADPQGGYADPQGGYADPQGGYADPQGGYAYAREGYEWDAPDGYAGDAYLGPGSYVEPGAVLTDSRVITHDAGLTAPDAGVHPDRWRAEQARRREARRRGLMVGPVSELLAIGVVLGVSTLAAALLKSAISPVSAMAAVFAGRMPAALRNAIVHHFGAHSGSVLLFGMYATFAVVAIVIGALARRDAAAGVAGVATFTLFAAFVTITRPASHVGDVMPVVIGGLAGVAAAMWLFRASTPQLTEGRIAREPLRAGPVRYGHGGTRRRTR
jgi:hypothetical protein